MYIYASTYTHIYIHIYIHTPTKRDRLTMQGNPYT